MKYVESIYKVKPEHFDDLVKLLEENLFPKAEKFGATELQISSNRDECTVIGHGNYPKGESAVEFAKVIADELETINNYCQALPERGIYDVDCVFSIQNEKLTD